MRCISESIAIVRYSPDTRELCSWGLVSFVGLARQLSRGVDYGLHSVFLYCVGAHQNVYLHTDLGESCALRIVFVHFSATAAAISLDFG